MHAFISTRMNSSYLNISVILLIMSNVIILVLHNCHNVGVKLSLIIDSSYLMYHLCIVSLLYAMLRKMIILAMHNSPIRRRYACNYSTANVQFQIFVILLIMSNVAQNDNLSVV